MAVWIWTYLIYQQHWTTKKTITLHTHYKDNHTPHTLQTHTHKQLVVIITSMCIENILCDANFILFPEVQVYVYVYVYFPQLCLTMHPNMLYLNKRIVNRKTHSLKPLEVEGTNDESSTEHLSRRRMIVSRNLQKFLRPLKI